MIVECWLRASAILRKGQKNEFLVCKKLNDV